LLKISQKVEIRKNILKKSFKTVFGDFRKSQKIRLWWENFLSKSIQIRFALKENAGADTGGGAMGAIAPSPE
jgi:hypothetical protein